MLATSHESDDDDDVISGMVHWYITQPATSKTQRSEFDMQHVRTPQAISLSTCIKSRRRGRLVRLPHIARHSRPVPGAAVRRTTTSRARRHHCHSRPADRRVKRGQSAPGWILLCSICSVESYARRIQLTNYVRFALVASQNKTQRRNVINPVRLTA